MNPATMFHCSECGPSERPCKHHEKSENDFRFMWIERALCEIIHILNRPQSATMSLRANKPSLVGGK